MHFTCYKLEVQPSHVTTLKVGPKSHDESALTTLASLNDLPLSYTPYPNEKPDKQPLASPSNGLRSVAVQLSGALAWTFVRLQKETHKR